MIMENLSDQSIYSPHSRQQAIADGALIDISHNDAIRARWKYPLAVDEIVWNCIETASCENEGNLNEILDNISADAERQIALHGHADNVTFLAKIGRYLMRLKLRLDSADGHEPVLTLLLEDED